MHIGIDGMALAQPRTGVGTYTFELARALASTAPQNSIDLISPLPFEAEIFDEIRPTNLRFIYSKPTNMLQRRWWIIGAAHYLRDHPVDLFHGTNYEIPLFGRCRTAITIHDLSVLLCPDTHEIKRVRRGKLRLPLMARKAAQIITPSDQVRCEVIEHLGIHPEKVSATPLAPRTSFSPMTPRETVETRRRLGVEDEFLLFVGTIEPRKNLLTLLLALEEVIRSTDLRPQLVIVGDVGWESDIFLSALERSPARPRVVLAGFQSDKDLRALYSSCRAFVYPSIYEGFGLPPLEAMACGAPVITSRVPSVNESVVRVVSPTDFRQLARIIVEWWRDAKERRFLSERGLGYVKNFSWDRTAAMTREVYARALTGPTIR